MKNKLSIGLIAVGIFAMGLTACGKQGGESSEVIKEFSFSIALSNGSKTLNKGEEAHIVITAEGGEPDAARDYTYASSDPAVAAINSVGTVTALAKGEARITVKENNSGKSQTLSLSITDANPASGGYNFASLAGQEAVQVRTEILGQLEKYAMDNHLTGITLFENGGYVKYNPRVKLPTTGGVV